MHAHKHSTYRRRGGLVATAVAVVGLVGGLSAIGVALASQRRAPFVRPVNDASGATLAPVIGASDTWLNSVLPDRASATYSVPDAIPVPSEIVPVMLSSQPVALDIPAIDVHSVVNDLGLTSEGALETPAPGPHYNEAAWYRYSPTPGELGPAILLGHIDSAADGPSVFFRLGEVEPGDEVSVTRADGSVAVFIVDAVHSYPKDDFPTELVYGDIDHAGLRILTCGGAFDDAAGHYLDNVVVFASLAEVKGEALNR